MIKTAIETNAKASASFTANDRAKIERTIKDTFTSDRKKKGLSPAADDIVFSVRQIVKEMDDFALKTAGSRIAASLPGHLAARSEAVAAERKAREVRHAANLEKIEVSEKRCADWKKRFDELIQPPSIEDGGGSVWERGSDIWVEEVHDWLRLNPQPTRFVESNGGLQHIVDNTANDSIAQAVQEYADQCSQFRASEKAEQSKEEETEIPF